MRYVYQYKDWPQFYWDEQEVTRLLGTVRNLQGRLVGKMETLGFELKTEALMQTMTLEVLKSSEIEGEVFNYEEVRSSLARQLGLKFSGMVNSGRDVDAVVEMMLDATHKAEEKLTHDRLHGWQAALFPSGHSGIYKIEVGKYRTDSSGAMQVVSGAMGKERVHFQAPAAKVLKSEMTQFLKWFNGNNQLDLVLKAALAHFWFVTLHPFDDGNGRLARAITEMLLTRSDGSPLRFYSMSAQIRLERKAYYAVLEKSQKGDLDVTNWLRWFLNCLQNAILASDKLLSRTLNKHQFWSRHAKTIFNERQKKILNKLLDEFDGKLNTSKWAKINKCSTDTALRDVQDLVSKKVLRKENSGGRSTSYDLVKEFRV
ncbi:MAG: Fic family protein [Crocinitomicaceae bacterium]|nr:Fic family protein [Crocinitomicaceae bacterium]